MPHANRLQPRVFRPPSPGHLEDLLRHIHKTRIEHHLLESTGNEHIEAHFDRGLLKEVEPVEDLAIWGVYVVVGCRMEIEFREFDVAAGFDGPKGVLGSG